MTKIIGLTGGIGSGKTTVANHFKQAGIPVYIADEEARRISNSPEVFQEIKNKFGEDVFDGTILNRQKMAQIVFNNSEKLSQLNAIIHPAVRKHFQDWLTAHPEAEFVLYEAAILFESESYKNCDLIITVTAPLEDRIQRVILRDKTTREQVISRINAQWDDEQRTSKSHFVIENVDLKTSAIEIDKILKILRNS